jgi:hypothetical protein
MATISEKLGDREQAAADYRQVIELSRNCDPELRPLVVLAHRRLAALQGQEREDG